MGKILRISLKLNFTPNTLGCYRLIWSPLKVQNDRFLSDDWGCLTSVKISDGGRLTPHPPTATPLTNKKVSSIRTPMLIKARLERMETNLMPFKREVTWTHGNQLNNFKRGSVWIVTLYKLSALCLATQSIRSDVTEALNSQRKSLLHGSNLSNASLFYYTCSSLRQKVKHQMWLGPLFCRKEWNSNPLMSIVNTRMSSIYR